MLIVFNINNICSYFILSMVYKYKINILFILGYIKNKKYLNVMILQELTDLQTFIKQIAIICQILA